MQARRNKIKTDFVCKLTEFAERSAGTENATKQDLRGKRKGSRLVPGVPPYISYIGMCRPKEYGF